MTDPSRTDLIRAPIVHATADDAITQSFSRLLQSPDLEQIAAAVDEVFWLFSVNPFSLLYCNPAAKTVWGFDPMVDAGDTSGRHVERMIAHIHSEDLGIIAELAAVVQGEALEREYRIVDVNGEVRWVRTRAFPVFDGEGNVYRISAVSVDITARKRAERELKLYRTFDRLMLHVSKDFASVTTERVDESFQNALRDIAGLLGAGCAAISLIDDSGARLRLRWRWAGSEFGPTPFSEISFPPGDPQRRLLELLGVAQVGSVAELPDDFANTRDRLLRSGFRSMVNIGLFAHGQLIGVLGFGAAVEGKTWPPELHELVELAGELFTNVIERLRSEAMTRSHRDQLAHVLRLGTMGQLAAGIAHELNQPLSAIVSYARGCVRRLSENEIEPQQLRDALEKITSQALRAGGVIRTLRELVRAENHLSRENIFDVVTNVITLIEPEYLAANIRLGVEVDSDLPSVQIDRTQIEQVLINLLQNSYDALTIASPEGPREVRVSARCSGDGAVEISVLDTGPGIDPAHVDSIFDDFHTSKQHGLGLGLSISRSIVEAHGGRIWFDPPTGDGASFHLTLPVTRSSNVS